jgi:tellurite resistance protein
MNYFSNRINLLNTDVGMYFTLAVILSSLMVSMADSTLINQEKEKTLELTKAFTQDDLTPK